MAWNSLVISDRQITEDQIQTIVDGLPKELLGTHGTEKLPWGWDCYCAIKIPRGNLVTIEGSYACDRKLAAEFITKVTNQLGDLGHPHVTATPMK